MLPNDVEKDYLTGSDSGKKENFEPDVIENGSLELACYPLQKSHAQHDGSRW